MPTHSRTALLALILTTAVATLHAQVGPAPAATPAAFGDAVRRITTTDLRSAPAAAGRNSFVSGLLGNPTSSTLYLTAAATPMAGQVSLQRYTRGAGDLLVLLPVEAITLAPHSVVVITPGSLEVQLINLAAPLQSGLEVPLELTFASTPTQISSTLSFTRTVRVPVGTPLAQNTPVTP